ncbi:MAG: hypothetical protein QOJ60_2453 [Actinomycetota bacterium]|nr:hypothetical protein [Actinomycetota bacterium]
MLVWFAVALLVAAPLVALRWWVRRVDALGRRRRFPAVTVVVLLLFGIGLLVPVVRHRELEDRLSTVASQLVGHPVRVHCQTVGQELLDAGAELGYVRFHDGVPEPATLIKREQCHDITAYLQSNRGHPGLDEAVAVHVLTHESMHMAGISVESTAECEAVQRDAQTARLLGSSETDALTLARVYWQQAYPEMPPAYRTVDCRPGGPLDEHLPDAPWSP